MIRVLGIALVAVALGAHATAAAATCTFNTTPKSADVDAALRDVAAKRVDKAKADEAAVGKSTGSMEQNAAAKAAAALTKAEVSLASALAEPLTNTVNLDELTRLAITLTNPVSERLRVSFDETGGAHREVEWDPAVSSSLTREVRLETGDWTISVSAEPQTFNQPAGTVVIRARFGTLAAGTQTTTIDGAYVAMSIGAAMSAPAVITAWPRPQLTLVCEPKASQTMAELQFATSVTTSAADGSVRGLGVAPAIVTETLALLAEIAIDRARAGALEVLKKRLVDPFCDGITLAKLKLGAIGEPALPRTCELLRSLRLDDVLSSGRPILLALRDDLRFTIAPAVAEKLSEKDAQKWAVMRAVVSIVNTMIDRGGFDALQGQLALELLAQLEHVGLADVAAATNLEGDLVAALTGSAQLQQIANHLGATCVAAAACTATEVAKAMLSKIAASGWSWRDTNTSLEVVKAIVTAVDKPSSVTVSNAIAYGCQTRLIVAIVKRCSGGGCTAADLTTMIKSPQDYFATEETLPGALCWRFTPPAATYVTVPSNTDAAAVQRLVIDGLALVGPVADGQGRDRARAAVRLVIQLAQRVGTTDQLRKLTAFGDLAVAIIDEDYGTAFGRFLSLVDALLPKGEKDALESHKVVRKFAQLIGAVASYAVVYRETKDTDPQAAREARKRALSAIIDGMTDRSERGDERVVSLGSNVGLSYGWRDVDQRSNNPQVAGAGDDPWQPAVRVPLGVRLECLRKRDAKGLSAVGGFISLNLIDLGQFVRGDEEDDLATVEWADFVGIGAEVGVSYARLSRELNLSFHASYAPSIRYQADDSTEDPDTDADVRAGVWTFGFALGYYVPFIDLN